jgi:hypothetical protein
MASCIVTSFHSKRQTILIINIVVLQQRVYCMAGIIIKKYVIYDGEFSQTGYSIMERFVFFGGLN